MSRHANHARAVGLALLAVANACSDSVSQDYELRIYGEAYVESAIPASVVEDGWEIEFTEFVVAIGEVAVQADDAVELPGWHVYDMTAPSGGEGQLVAPFTASGELDRVAFRFGRPDEVEGGNATTAQVELLRERGWGLHVTGVARRDESEVAFDWGMPIEYGHDCELGQAVAEPAPWGPTIFIHADHLLIDDLEHDPRTTFDLIASGDADGDGTVTPSELTAVELLTLDRYQSGGRAIPDLWNYIGALAGTLGHIDGEGGCDPVLVPRRHRDRENPYEHADGSRELYLEHCASCHGETGGGDGPLAESSWPRASNLNLLTPTTTRDDYLYFRVLEGGAFFPYGSEMPGFEGMLTEEEIWRVVSYVQSLAHGGG
jgi:hypothetical protein